MQVHEIARVCHEINRAYCTAMGDNSQKPWGDAPDWQQQSAVNGVTKRLSNPYAPPSSSHESWMAEKVAEGWRYGPVKNPAIKEHPCMVPFEQLPPSQQAKDYIFVAVVDQLKNYLVE